MSSRINHDAVLDRWHAGESSRKIGEALGVQSEAVRTIVQRARKAGDRRALVKRVVYCHDHDAILSRWAAGATEGDIAAALGMKHTAVRQVVCDARKRGDHRAAYHGRHPPRPKRAKDSDRSLTNKISRGTAKKPRSAPPPAPVPFVEPKPVDVPYAGPCYGILDDRLKHSMCRSIVDGSGPTTLFCSAPTVDGPFRFCRDHAAAYLTAPTGRTWSPERRQKQTLAIIRRRAGVAANA